MSNIVDLAHHGGTAECLPGDALVSYLYEECAPEERSRIEQHLASCAACAGEVDVLAGTRVQLASWTPPDAALGFRITSDVMPMASAAPLVTPSAVGTSRLPWWRQPMPAWAQAVAATVLFGLGMAAGNRQLPIAPVASSAPAATVSASQLENLESRLRREMAAMRTSSPSPVAPTTVRMNDADRDAVMREVRQLVRESEDRQQQTFTLRAAQVARDAEIQRRVDVANLRQSFAQMQGSTSEEVRQQREMLNYLVNVSQRR